MPIALEFTMLAAIWGASFLLAKWGALEFGAVTTGFLRVLMAVPFLLIILKFKGGFVDLKKHWKPIFFVGALNSGLPFVFYAFAVLHVNTGLTAILNATTPLWGAIIAWLWLHDKLSTSRVLGLTIGFAGVAALAWDTASFKAGASMPGWAVLACLAAALCYGIAASFAKKYLAGVSPYASAAGSQIGASLLLFIPGLLTWPAQAPSTKAWGAIIVMSIFCTGIAYILYFRLIERMGAAKAVSVTFLIPVFGVAYGVLLLNEPFTLKTLICGVVIIFGTALATGVIKLSAKR